MPTSDAADLLADRAGLPCPGGEPQPGRLGDGLLPGPGRGPLSRHRGRRRQCHGPLAGGERPPPTRLSLGYIRHATQGQIELANTGPYLRELNGRVHGFAHNGNLARLFEEAEPAGHYRPVGATDSELAFCRLLSGMERLAAPLHALPSLEARLEVVAEMALALRRLGPANFLY